MAGGWKNHRKVPSSYCTIEAWEPGPNLFVMLPTSFIAPPSNFENAWDGNRRVHHHGEAGRRLPLRTADAHALTDAQPPLAVRAILNGAAELSRQARRKKRAHRGRFLLLGSGSK